MNDTTPAASGAAPALPKPFGYVRDNYGDGHVFQHTPFSGKDALMCSTAQVYSHAQMLAALASREASSATLTDAREQLRAEQAANVMPQIGPLLDAWDGLDNDTACLIRDEAPDLKKALEAINHAMEGAVPHPASAETDEQSVFETWLEETCPSGDHEAVQRQWQSSSAYRDFCGLAAPVQVAPALTTKQVASVFRAAIGGMAPLKTPASRVKARRAIASAKTEALREAICSIREKARETPSWAHGYHSAITAIELQIAALEPQ